MCEARDKNDSWPTKFSRVLCHVLLEVGFGPGELGRRIGYVPVTIQAWINGKRSPRRSSADLMERTLDLEPGTLTAYTGRLEKALSERAKAMWGKRRHRAGTLEKRRELILGGKYTDGVLPVERLHNGLAAWTASGSMRKRTLKGRLTGAIRLICRPGRGEFYECLSVDCRKPIYYVNSRAAHSDTYWHVKCWHSHLRSATPGYRPPAKPGATISTRIVATLLHDGLGMPYGKIAQRLQLITVDASEAMRARVRRGREDLEGLLWGELFPLGRRPPESVHGLLRYYSVTDALRVARGEHPLSNETDMDRVARWSPEAETTMFSDVNFIAEAPLAQALGKALNGRFPSLYAVAEHTGINHSVFRKLLDNKQQYVKASTIPILCELMDMDEGDVRELMAQSGQPSWRLGQKFPEVSGANHWRNKPMTSLMKENTAKQAVAHSRVLLMKRNEWSSPFAQALTTALIDSEKSIGGLANIVGVHESTVANWTNTRLPSETTVMKIESVLGLAPNFLESLIPSGERERRRSLSGPKPKLAVEP